MSKKWTITFTLTLALTLQLQLKLQLQVLQDTKTTTGTTQLHLWCKRLHFTGNQQIIKTQKTNKPKNTPQKNKPNKQTKTKQTLKNNKQKQNNNKQRTVLKLRETLCFSLIYNYTYTWNYSYSYNYNYTTLHYIIYTALVTVHYTNYHTLIALHSNYNYKNNYNPVRYTYATLHCPALRCAALHYATTSTSTNFYHYHCTYNYTTLQLHYNSNSITLRYFTTTNTTALHYIQQVCIRWSLQPLQKTQLQPPFGPSAGSLCHPIATTRPLQ